MRKLKILLILPLLLLAGCSNMDSDGDHLRLQPSFVEVCHHLSLYFIRDKATDIMYMYYDTSYHTGLSPYYNADGKPMTYTEFQEVHTARYH